VQSLAFGNALPKAFTLHETRGCASCTVALLPFTLKKYLKAKEEEELWKLKYFTMQKLHNLQKIL
jgi:hypothetical protein